MRLELKKGQRILAIRHSQPLGAEGLCYGQRDLPVGADISELAQSLAKSIDLSPHARLWSSPLTRCLLLAQSLAGSRFVCLDARLQELDFGRWEGRLWSSIPREESEFWIRDIVNQVVPEGESYQQLIERVSGFLQGVIQQELKGEIILITHAGVIRALYHLLMPVDARESLNLAVPFGSLHQFGEGSF